MVTLNNTSGVDAFDVSVSEILPTLVSGSAVLSPTFVVTGTSGASAADFQWAIGSSDATSWQLEDSPTSDIHLLAGQSLTITVTGALSDSVVTGLVLTDQKSWWNIKKARRST